MKNTKQSAPTAAAQVENCVYTNYSHSLEQGVKNLVAKAFKEGLVDFNDELEVHMPIGAYSHYENELGGRIVVAERKFQDSTRYCIRTFTAVGPTFVVPVRDGQNAALVRGTIIVGYLNLPVMDLQ